MKGKKPEVKTLAALVHSIRLEILEAAQVNQQKATDNQWKNNGRYFEKITESGTEFSCSNNGKVLSFEAKKGPFSGSKIDIPPYNDPIIRSPNDLQPLLNFFTTEFDEVRGDASARFSSAIVPPLAPNFEPAPLAAAAAFPNPAVIDIDGEALSGELDLLMIEDHLLMLGDHLPGRDEFLRTHPEVEDDPPMPPEEEEAPPFPEEIAGVAPDLDGLAAIEAARAEEAREAARIRAFIAGQGVAVAPPPQIPFQPRPPEAPIPPRLLREFEEKKADDVRLEAAILFAERRAEEFEAARIRDIAAREAAALLLGAPDGEPPLPVLPVAPMVVPAPRAEIDAVVPPPPVLSDDETDLDEGDEPPEILHPAPPPEEADALAPDGEPGHPPLPDPLVIPPVIPAAPAAVPIAAAPRPAMRVPMAIPLPPAHRAPAPIIPEAPAAPEGEPDHLLPAPPVIPMAVPAPRPRRDAVVPPHPGPLPRLPLRPRPPIPEHLVRAEREPLPGLPVPPAIPAAPAAVPPAHQPARLVPIARPLHPMPAPALIPPVPAPIVAVVPPPLPPVPPAPPAAPMIPPAPFIPFYAPALPAAIPDAAIAKDISNNDQNKIPAKPKLDTSKIKEARDAIMKWYKAKPEIVNGSEVQIKDPVPIKAVEIFLEATLDQIKTTRPPTKIKPINAVHVADTGKINAPVVP